MNTSARLWFIVLNYNNYQDTAECIDSIHNNKDDRFNVIIVDNCSLDSSGIKLKEKFYNDTCLLLESNDGYAAGNNIGIKYAIEHGAQYICVLNNDVVVPPSFVKSALEVLERCGIYSVISPLVCEYYNPEYIQSAGAKISLLTGQGPGLHYGELADNVDLAGDEPHYLGGACFIAHRDVFVKCGLIPEFYFLFYEETDWFFTLKECGVKFFCNSSLRVYHKGSSSIGQVEGLSNYYLTRNQVIFERRKANSLQFVIYCIYSIVRYLYSILRYGKPKFSMKAFCDGLLFDWED